ncbi:MAG: BamA/TamA family outer membrane protein [Ferruginibacter sp.]|nr:BamA/TamA family outer membrane protein [Ferruginibacter sp.]
MTIIKYIFYVLLLTSLVIALAKISAVYSQPLAVNKYRLIIKYADKDSSFDSGALKLSTAFAGQVQCMDYVTKLPALLNLKGYPAASVDSFHYDSTFASVLLFLGKQQYLLQLRTGNIDRKALDFSGFSEKNFIDKPVDMARLEGIKERIVNYYEKNGYPFAAVFLDSIQLTSGALNASLTVNKGPLYHIDSIRIRGKVKISNSFLQRYLGIPNGSIYNKDKLDQVGKRLLELPYLQEQQPSELMMLGKGSVLDIYLLPKKSSQVNFLVGVLPANSQTNKLQLTGDVNLNLRNALGTGETILINWQQLQISSPRINIGFQQPYIFKSAFGLDFAFDLFKKDSTFLQLNAQLGIQYLLSASQSGKIFFQNQNSFLLGSGVDTNLVKATRQLPLNIDVRAVNIGLDYEINTTNYRFNPSSGNELRLVGSVGIKTISRNNEILTLKDPSFDFSSLYDSIKLRTYQLRAKLMAAHYFPAGKRSTFKTVFNGGIFSSQRIFRNELFQVGGYKLLRGFDEESIYATQYGVLTLEYRNLVGLNSYIFTFMDAAWVKNKYQAININNSFISAGLGMVFETRAGLLNMSFAVGKRNDVKLDLKQASKIHFGYINYF